MLKRCDYGEKINAVLDKEITLTITGWELGMINAILGVHKDWINPMDEMYKYFDSFSLKIHREIIKLAPHIEVEVH